MQFGFKANHSTIMCSLVFHEIINHCITFNTKKTVCIKFGELIKPQEFAKLDGQLLKWQTNVRHLGNYLNNTLDNSVDSTRISSVSLII